MKLLIRFFEVNLKRRSASTRPCLREESTRALHYGTSYVGVAPSTRFLPHVSPINLGGFDPTKRSGHLFGVLASSIVARREISDIPNDEQEVGSSEDGNSLLVSRILAEIPPLPSSMGYIFRVPARIRVEGEDTYDPRILSIGPYHHGKDSLKAYEKYKKWYLQSFISRTASPETSLADFVKAIKELEVDARECYGEPIDLSSDEFVMMMIHDGCFMLELFLKFSQCQLNVDKKDHIFRTTWIVPSLRRDLLLLENQIPFVVLECLFDLTNTSIQCDHSLYKLVTNFFHPILPRTQNIQTQCSLKCHHLLDLLRSHLLHPFRQLKPGKYPRCEYTESATELGRAGVKFRKKDESLGLLDITFTKNGVLEIPPFRFGMSWTVLIPNLVALEQCRQDYEDQITSYVILLDSLIDSHSDVKLLRRAGIVDDDMFKEDENVALAMNGLYKRIVVDEFYYDGLCRQVNSYSGKRTRQIRATFRREYLRISAALLVVLTLIHTILSISEAAVHLVYSEWFAKFSARVIHYLHSEGFTKFIEWVVYLQEKLFGDF